MDFDKKYILNPYYILRPDRHRVILTESGSYFKIPSQFAEDSFYSFIHPIFAVILSFFNGKNNLWETIQNLKNHFDTSEDKLLLILAKLIYNKERTGFLMQGFLSEFPKNVLIEYSDDYGYRNYSAEMFENIKALDFTTEKLFEGPLDINILVNTRCGTDCEYCYVDRSVRQDCQIDLYRLLDIIDEAKFLGVRKFDIAGTEIFLYKHWELLVKKLISCNYYPYLSTKIPIDKRTIKKLRDLGIKHLQVSIDSTQPDAISAMWKVNGTHYVTNLIQSLKEISRQGITLQINVVITKTNHSATELINLLNILNQIDSVNHVVLNEAGPSTAKTESQFKNFRLNREQIDHIIHLVDQVEKDNQYRFSISFSQGALKEDYVNSYSKKEAKFKKRAACPAGIRGFTILCDGKVTICEELYWTKQFIIGDILKQSISEIWNSERATWFSELSTDDFHNKSTCFTCAHFNTCRKSGIGVCWSKVIQAYGQDHWKYPDPSCPIAAEPFYEIYSD